MGDHGDSPMPGINRGQASAGQGAEPYVVLPFRLSAKFKPSCNPIKPALPETLKSDRMVESKSLDDGKLCPRNISEKRSSCNNAEALLCNSIAAVSMAISSVICNGESAGALLLGGELLGGGLLGGGLMGGGGGLLFSEPTLTLLEKAEVLPEVSVSVATIRG